MYPGIFFVYNISLCQQDRVYDREVNHIDSRFFLSDNATKMYKNIYIYLFWYILVYDAQLKQFEL